MVIFCWLIQLFEIQNKAMRAIFLWAYENIRNVLSSWVCGFVNNPPFKKTFNLLINDIYLQWIEIVLAGYKKLSGLLIKVNCDPSNRTEDPLIWGDGLPFGRNIFQSTCRAWIECIEWNARLASQLIRSYVVCSTRTPLCALNFEGGFLCRPWPWAKNDFDDSDMILVS